MKCNDLIIELAYLSSLNFCMPILERLPPITIHYIHFSTTEPIPLLPPNLFVHSISFLLETPFPYPSLLANSYSFSSRLAKPSQNPMTELCPSNQPSKACLFLSKHLSDYTCCVCLMGNIFSIWCNAYPRLLVRVGVVL